MKTMMMAVIALLLVLVLRQGLPSNSFKSEEMQMKEDTSYLKKMVGITAMKVSSWEIQDYIVFKVARSSWLNIDMIAIPYLGWSRLSEEEGDKA